MAGKKHYRWNTPYQWLSEKIEYLSQGDLIDVALTFAQLAGNDAIQDLFQKEMTADGYFEPMEE